jgi:subfamily B ATP-binding cassette protein MsbA
MNSRQLYFRLLRYVRPYISKLLVSIGLLALLAATEPLFPALMKPLLDEGFTKQDQSFITWLPILIIGLFILRGILTFSSSYASNWVSSRVVGDLRNEMFKKLLSLPTAFFDNNSSGSLASKIAYDVNNVAGSATHVLTTLVRDSLTIIALLAWLFWLDWKLTMITFVLAPFFMVIIKYFNKRMRHLSRESQLSMARLSHLIEQASSSHKVVKIFHGQPYEAKRFSDSNKWQRQLSVKAGVAAAAVVPLTQILTSIAVAVIIAIALSGTNESTSTAGGFMSFLAGVLMLLAPLKRLADINPSLQRGLAAAESAFQILDEESEKDQGIQFIDAKNLDVQFKNVTFKYPGADRTVLNNVTINFDHDKTTALVGRSGSGKTTVINLLMRLYDPSQGSINIGQHETTSLSLKNLRSQIALVSQDVRLFNDSILANVSYGSDTSDPKKAELAMKHANAWEFVSRLPEGIHTKIGQDGIKLSGGQRQRLAIARAFYKDAPILVLDEATSALDTESERQIQEALGRLSQQRTTIVIAHRLSTIENADKIVVMDHGEVIETGTHKELIQNSEGTYAGFHRLQFSETSLN